MLTKPSINPSQNHNLRFHSSPQNSNPNHSKTHTKMFHGYKVTRFLPHHHKNPCKFQSFRAFVVDVEIKFIRDRGLDHAVEREKDLKPMINLKNLLKSEPSKSLPLSSIVDNKDALKIPFRPIEFIRKYPCVFQEFFPGNIGIHPHVRLTPAILDIDAQEQLVLNRVDVRKSAAERLLKLLMLCRVNEIPLKVIDRLKWDLGLPDNYADSLVPEFPDYFQVKRGNGVEGMLELVCWSDELAVSVMEKMAKKAKKEFEKGMPIAFPLKFSTGFEMDKRLKKWIDEWQKLPYVSPYENAANLQPNSDESDKWAVAVMHELLHILVPKKTDRDNILDFGEYMGIRARFKRAVIHHPGIFYLSSKNGTYTVVLREGYKRGLLIDKHPLMDMRSMYIHIMHTEKKEAQKPKDGASTSDSKQQGVGEGSTGTENEKEGKEPDIAEQDSVSDVEESIDDDEEDEEEEGGRGRRRSGRRGSDMVNDRDQAKNGRRSGRSRFGKSDREVDARGGSRSGRRGYGRDQAEEGQRSGRRGSGKVNEEQSGGGHKRRSSWVNIEEQSRGGHRSGRRESGKVNEEQARGGRSRGHSRVSFGAARDGHRSGRRDSGNVDEGGKKGKELLRGRSPHGNTPY